MFSHVQLFATPWTVDCLAPLSMGFSRREYCSGLPFPPPGELPDPGVQLASPALEADFLLLSRQGSPVEGILSEISQSPKDKCCVIHPTYMRYPE